MSKNQRRVFAGGKSRFGNLFLHLDSKRSSLPAALSMVGVAGFEPATLRLSSACSNQLSYTPVGWWRHGDSNPRPIACKATALPTELCPQELESGFEVSAIGRIGNRSKN